MIMFLLILALASTPVRASTGRIPLMQTDMKFDRISVEQGLSNFTVSSIAQDQYGFLWFGTEDGLNRYDGYTFTVYRPDEKDSTSLTGSIISHLYVDQRGVLWVGVLNGGLCRYDPQRNAFVRYVGSGTPARWSNVSGMVEDSQGRLWLCTNGGLWRYEATRDSFVFFDYPTDEGQRLAHTSTKCADIDSRGVWWIISHTERLYSYDPATNHVQQYRAANGRQFLPLEEEVISVCADKRGDIWVGTLKGLYRYRASTGELENFKKRNVPGVHLTNGIILDTREDSRGNVWIGTFHGGLYRYIPEADTFLNFRHDPDDERSIVSNRIELMFEDMTGALWFSSYRAGLNKYTPVTNPFFRFKHATPRRSGINGDAVYAIAQDSAGRIWFGTNESGITLFDPSTGTYLPLPANAPHYNTLGIAVDKYGAVWASEGINLMKLSPQSNRFVPISLRPRRTLVQNAEIKTIMHDSRGNTWIGTNEGGLFRIDGATGRTTHFMYDPNDSTSLPWVSIWCVLEDRRKNIWVASFGNGIARYDEATGAFIRYTHKTDDPTTISGHLVYSMTEDAEGYLWLGMFSRGLNRFDPKTGRAVRFTDRDGLPNNFVKAVLPDNSGNLWISTDRGIAKFDPRTRTFTPFTTADGLHGNVFLSGAYCRTPGGMLLFGGMNGATAFIPEEIMKIKTPPPIVFTSFKLFDQPYSLPQPLNDLNTLELSHDQNFVSFEFSALDFTASERNRYKYMMDGLDTGWVDAGTRRFARYTHLPPGEFVFRVIGANKDGVWNTIGRSIGVRIRPPFWQTWWFLSLALLALIAAGTTLYNYRVNRLLEIERLRVRIASDLHDDIGSSLTKISLQSELIQEGVEPGERDNYLRNIATLSRELVQSMSDIVWSIDARNDTLENVLEKMKSFGSGTLAARDIAFSFSHSGLDGKKKIPVDVRENLFLMYKEAINNIAKHANAHHVNVVLRNDSDKFTMLILDDGKGWEGAERPTGHGTRNMKMRAQRLGGSLEFVRDEGTRVLFTMSRI